jgi:hypothetical protein
MRGRAETVTSAAVWADTTRPYPVGQEGVQAMVDISFRLAHFSSHVEALWKQKRQDPESSKLNSLFDQN